MPYTYEYPRPMVTVDVVVAAPGAKGPEILLIRRGREPFKGMWALPGGFLDIDEELEDGAARELREETGLEVEAAALREIGLFGALGRDPRGRTITAAYLAVFDERGETRPGDDAAETGWFPIDDPPPTAFDHDEIIARARALL